MTRFTVTWIKTALAELANLWLEADDREAVTLATAFIDRELSFDPEAKVQPLSEGLAFIDHFRCASFVLPDALIILSFATRQGCHAHVRVAMVSLDFHHLCIFAHDRR